jgi:glycosyltransferase involved in cell wall biosynthesis
VRFLGFVDDIRPVMVACDALVFPTQPELSEGFGLAALEAMAAGRATIASDVGSLPELVEHRVTGMLVAPRPPDELTRAILDLAGDRQLCVRLGDEAARRARSSFTLESMVSRTIDVYAEVA